MSSNTGNLSLWLSIFFILASLLGVVTVYLLIMNKNVDNERIDKIIDIGKWFIVSVAITLSATIVNDGFREREQDIKEMEIFDKYVATILESNSLEKRKLLCEYFASVSPEGAMKQSWKQYEKIVDQHIYEDKKDINKIVEIDKKIETGVATDLDKQQKAILEEKSKIRNQSLVLREDEKKMVIIAGGDKSVELANDEIKKVKALNYSGIIYKKGGSYRTVVGPFPDEGIMIAALGELKEKVNKTAYPVDVRVWCQSPEEKPDYIACK
ncbi:SPOR domain-containing protein [Chitinibacter sp. S2-10]|uniref:SPOR domain-containing protein n=1 Tax=Chitinibacter sp. S2-10 TaxID=3373597 RepID=UPI0039779BD6